MNKYIKRKIDISLTKHQDSSDAIVLTGFRRVGKTAVVRNIFDNLKTRNKIFLDLESPVNQQIFENPNYEGIVTNLTGLGIDFTRRAFIFLDEIQKIKNIPSIVKYLIDHYNIKFYLTGSSSYYLKNHFSESLSGRKLVFELYPLDFEEFLVFRGSRLSLSTGYKKLSDLYNEFVQFGGFPSVVLESSAEKKSFKLDDILGAYFELDVASLSNFRDNDNLKKLMFLLATRTGNKLDTGKLSQSLGVSRPTVYEYIAFFEQTYLINLLRPMAGSSDVQIRSIPKLYFLDTGLLNRIGTVSAGAQFENKIFNQLHQSLVLTYYQTAKQPVLEYFQLKTGAEIDFVVEKTRGYEVKLLATSSDYAQLKRIATKLGLSEYKLVSLQEPKGVLENMFVYPYAL